jgi:predicted glutamine amidotransferase
MCVILIKQKGKLLTPHFLDMVKASTINNPDGSGFMWLKEGADDIYLNKGYWPASRNGLAADIENLNAGINDVVVVHSRISTSGAKNDLNMHPFIVTENEEEKNLTCTVTKEPCLAHNGVISEFSISSIKSDTYLFTDFLAKNKILDNEKSIKWLSEHVSYNKLAILHPKMGLLRIGRWEKDEGYWVSNTYYQWAIKSIKEGKIPKERDYAY